MSGPGTSNHEKYTVGAQNPVVRRLMGRLFSRVRAEIAPLSASHMLDAGCGEGHALSALADVLPLQITGFDLNPAAVEHCRGLAPRGHFSVENIYALPYPNAAFDVVLCMEVLEHLERPGEALRELTRVCSGRLVLSVPYEPWFRLGNLARGKHLAGWGNHPEHVQWWDLAGFSAFLQGSPGLADVRVSEAWPWIVASARVTR